MKMFLIIIFILLVIAFIAWNQGYWPCDMWRAEYSNMTSIPIKWQMRCA